MVTGAQMMQGTLVLPTHDLAELQRRNWALALRFSCKLIFESTAVIMGWPAPLSAIGNMIAEFVRARGANGWISWCWGVDLGKNVCSIVGLGAEGQVLVRRRMRRESVAAFTRKWPSSVVAMEACCGAHHLGRQLAAQGHEVRLISPEYVRPYVKAQKNDDRDAEAIAEAATRPTMRFVEIKSEMQLEMQTLHPVRSLPARWYRSSSGCRRRRCCP